MIFDDVVGFVKMEIPSPKSAILFLFYFFKSHFDYRQKSNFVQENRISKSVKIQMKIYNFSKNVGSKINQEISTKTEQMFEAWI